MKSKGVKGKPKIIRACTVSQSLNFVTGMIPDLSQEYDVVLLSSPGENWTNVKNKYPNVKCIEIPMERRISLLKDLVSFVRLWWVFVKERPRMVHSMTPKAGLLCMMAAWFALVPKRVHTFTGLVFPTSVGLKKKILMLTDKMTSLFATHIIPEGKGVLDDLKNNGITKKPMKVLGYGNVKGVDLDFYRHTSEVNEQVTKLRIDDVFTFVFVGRIVRDKGINELVHAFVRLYQEHIKIRLVLVGPEENEFDPLKPDTSKLIETIDSIESVGKQSDVRVWLAMADVAILPSYREGFPNVVIEAGAMGLPQIVTDVNGSREIIIEGENGIIVPPKNEDSLYYAMKKLVENPAYVNFLASNARILITKRFEQGFVRRCLYDFYHEIICQ